MTGRRAAPPRTGGRGQTQGPGKCRWCHAKVWFLRHPNTGKVAPIDEYPAPRGNIAINVRAGTYSVVTETAALFELDPSRVDDDANPTLHLNHWVTCTNATARRLADERLGRSAPIGGEDVHRIPTTPPPAAEQPALPGLKPPVCGHRMVLSGGRLTRCALDVDHEGNHDPAPRL